ncbi:MAG: hypothetical protein D6753_14020, partial [Planctomycetota bacterium]
MRITIMSEPQPPGSLTSGPKGGPSDGELVEFAQIADALREALVPGELIEQICARLHEVRVNVPAWDRAAANLARFFRAARSPYSWLTLFERDPACLPTLLSLLASSPPLADQLVADPEAFELLRLTEGKPVDPDLLRDELFSELDGADHLRRAQRALRVFRYREFLRIAYGQMTGHQTWATAARERTWLAETVLQGALQWALRDTESHLPRPTQGDGQPVGVAVIGLGRLGGGEMDFGESLELMLVRESQQPSAHWSSPADQTDTELFFRRLAQTFLRLIDEVTEDGVAYRLEWAPAVMDASSPPVVEFREAVVHFENWGRTWQRQAMIKSRAVAGDIGLGEALLRELEPWIYRRYLLPPDTTGLVALKRRICRSTMAPPAGSEARQISLRLAVQRIEQLVEFLQLLHGGDRPQVRVGNTLRAIQQLTSAECFTEDQSNRLAAWYGLLRSALDAIQILQGPSADRLPADPAILRCAASIVDGSAHSASQPENRLVEAVYRAAANSDRFIDELLDRTCVAPELEQSLATPESDLVLDPKPAQSEIASVLQPYGFRDPLAAYNRLQEMAVESIPFLSSRRSRYALALIAPALLRMVSATPDPDATLIQLANVSESLGGKATLWELFRESRAAMQLGVRVSATSPYLVDILTSNPGMIDELFDSLMLARLPSREEMVATVAELCRQVDDVVPVLTSYKNSMHLRIGVRDIMGHDTIERTHATLADVAEVCLENLITQAYSHAVARFGLPAPFEPATESEWAGLCVVALEKLGGREPNYHSRLDLLFLYEGEGETRSLVPGPHSQPTTNRQFFNEVAQRVIQSSSRSGRKGRLYEVETPLRPMGTGGPLAVMISDLQEFFASGKATVSDILALPNARPIWGDPVIRARTSALLQGIMASSGWSPEIAEAICRRRLELQSTASPENLKRGAGG